MALYTFYPTLPNGLCDTFKSIALETEDLVAGEALKILADHESASTVVVYNGSRKVLTRWRVHSDLSAVLGREAPVGALVDD